MSYKNLQVLVRDGVLKKGDVGKEEFCENCVMEKSKKVSFEAGKHETDHVLDYVHANLWGSSHVQLPMSSNQYFLSIIDDHSRKVWIYFLKSKDETFTNSMNGKV